MNKLPFWHSCLQVQNKHCAATVGLHYFGFPLQPLATSRTRMFAAARPAKRCSMLRIPTRDEGPKSDGPPPDAAMTA